MNEFNEFPIPAVLLDVQEVLDSASQAQDARDLAETYAGVDHRAASWSALAAINGVSGDVGYVSEDDTGTHTDPITSGTVGNAGVYEWAADGLGSAQAERVGDTGLAGKADSEDFEQLKDRMGSVEFSQSGVEAGGGGLFRLISTNTASGVKRLLAEFRSSGWFAPTKLLIPQDAVIGDDLGTSLVDRLGGGAGEVVDTDLVFWGDSFMTRQAPNGYPEQTGAALGRDVYNGGIGGQTSTQITARQGAITALATVDGNEIPTSGPVSLSTAGGVLSAIYPLSTPATSSFSRSMNVTLAGIAGTLDMTEVSGNDSEDQYTFTRAQAGSAVFCAPNSPIIPTDRYLSRVNVIGIGRNNVGDHDKIMSEVAAIVASLGHGRFVIVGVTNGSTEPSGSAGYNNVRGLNAKLASVYRRKYLDIREYLIHKGLSHAGISETAADTANISDDIPPESLRDDSLHLNAAGTAIVADLLSDRIQELEF